MKFVNLLSSPFEVPIVSVCLPGTVCVLWDKPEQGAAVGCKQPRRSAGPHSGGLDKIEVKNGRTQKEKSKSRPVRDVPR